MFGLFEFDYLKKSSRLCGRLKIIPNSDNPSNSVTIYHIIVISFVWTRCSSFDKKSQLRKFSDVLMKEIRIILTNIGTQE